MFRNATKLHMNVDKWHRMLMIASLCSLSVPVMQMYLSLKDNYNVRSVCCILVVALIRVDLNALLNLVLCSFWKTFKCK